MRTALSTLFVLFVLIATGASCAYLPYENKSEVKSVRILATKADLPYAHPGETVNLEALVWDGREKPTLPMHFWWIPLAVPCTNPPGGNYFDCYPQLEATYPNIGVDISSQLVEDTKFQIHVPETALDGVVPPPGTNGEPLVTTWQFMIVCAGHPQRKVRTTAYQENQAPFGCFDDDGKELPFEQGEFGFMRVTVSKTARNNHPKIGAVVQRGRAVQPGEGLWFFRCFKGAAEVFFRGNCDTVGMDVTYDDADAEIDPANLDANGNPGRETIYTDWYVTLGRFPEPRRIERDPFKGRPEVPNNLYEPPRDPGHGLMWIVLHDNRGGTDWTSLPVEIR
jgi:hypothetical protein